MEFQRGFTNNLNTDFVHIMSEVRDTYYNNSINSNGTYGTKTATGNSRIYNCTHCERAFTREEHLSRHITSTHTKSKPFVCGICSRPFSRRDLLLRHAKSLHKGSEVAISRIRKSYKKSQDDAKEEEQEGPESDDSNSSSNSSLSDLRDVKMSVNTLVS